MVLPASCYTAITICCILIAAKSVHAKAGSDQKYTGNAVVAIQTLNLVWYGAGTGLWDNTWWNSANALTTIADFASLRLHEANQLNIGGYIRNTFIRAQNSNVPIRRAPANSRGISGRASSNKRGFNKFLNEYYDDEGWWALGLIKSYDVSGEGQYLAAAIDLFGDMQTGRGTPCHGGIYWSKERKYVSAIANELYLSVAASLARRVPQNDTYRLVAIAQWNWFESSGMINAQNLINDGLDHNCKNNGLQTWTYNQGVILGGLTELFLLTLDLKYLERATIIAKAAIKALSDSNGILTETDKCELRSERCRPTSQQFKGVFVRNLRYLYDAAPRQEFKEFILRNADSIWKSARNDNNQLGVGWAGDYTGATASSQSSALDALVAAVAVA